MRRCDWGRLRLHGLRHPHHEPRSRRRLRRRPNTRHDRSRSNRRPARRPPLQIQRRPDPLPQVLPRARRPPGQRMGRGEPRRRRRERGRLAYVRGGLHPAEPPVEHVRAVAVLAVHPSHVGLRPGLRTWVACDYPCGGRARVSRSCVWGCGTPVGSQLPLHPWLGDVTPAAAAPADAVAGVCAFPAYAESGYGEWGGVHSSAAAAASREEEQ